VSLKRLVDIGSSLPCEADLACVTPSAALSAAANAVSAITFTKPEGGLYLCSGQLLNDSASDNVPYFFTANHCIDSAAAAATITTYWFFDATACGSNTVRPDYVVQAAGSKLLARSDDWDWALMRLNAAPPAGAMFSAWRAEPVPPGSVLTVLHHPNGDLKKFSQGNATGYVADGLYNGPTPATFLNMAYTLGETEGGSSGSGVLTFNGAGGYYEVRGGLYSGANPSCPMPAGYFDVYSRMDNMVPNVREYLTPGNNPAGTVAAVEFYNAALDHYFLSTNPVEINDLDTGVHVGWVRTGLRFNAYATQVAGTSPVCRFYRSPAFGDSHFYSASPAECAATAAAHPVDWVYESANVFYVALPDPTSGACAANARPVWRFFNNVTTNHRYTAEVKDRDAMRFDPATWTAEGYGPDAVIMCSPVGG
jgi:lysyl endopeptidase